ncbi:MAG: hypothetical protein ACI959_001111 [Limisphaerales bacterium]|jgi:hypothetical protein
MRKNYINKISYLILACFLVFMGNSQIMAQCAAGETEVEIIINADPGNFPTDISWTLVDDVSGTVILSRACASYDYLLSSSTDLICLTDGNTYTLNLLDDYGDAWGALSSWEIVKTSDGCTISSGTNPDNLVFGDNTDDCVGDDLEESYTFDPAAAIMGCMDPTAINYNPCATIDDGSCIFPAINDECSNAIELPINTDGTCTLTGSSNLTGATFSSAVGAPSLSCYAGTATPNDVWFKFEIPASGAAYIELGPSTDLGFMLAEYFVGTCGALTPAPIVCGFPFGISAAGLTPGDTLFIRVWDDFPLFGGITAELCVQDPVIGCTDPCSVNYDPLALVDDGSCIPNTTAIEDLCADAISISEGSTYYDINGLTGTDITACTFNDFISGWFSFDVPLTCDTLQLSTCDANYDSGLSIWTACPGSGGTEVDCNDDDPFPGLCGGGVVSSLQTPTAGIAGTTVYIRVTGYNGASGCGNLIVNCISSGVVGPCITADAPDGLNSAVNIIPLTVDIDWNPIASSVMCQVRWRNNVVPGWDQKNYYGSEVSAATIPRAALEYGASYQWMVRCACDFDILDATPFSEQDTFVLPSAREVFVLNQELYPNPANQHLLVDYNSKESMDAVIRITDLTGRVIYAETRRIEVGAGTLRFSTALLEDGFYLLDIEGVVRRFAVTH